MNKYIILIAAVIMQMCLGATYSWAVFIQALRELTDLKQGALQLPFSCCIWQCLPGLLQD
jgi:OFA family oxalate/formate antiporter-like MFS transporter